MRGVIEKDFWEMVELKTDWLKITTGILFKTDNSDQI